MKKVLLSARNLCKSFANNGQQSHVLNNVDLDIYEGDFTVIMGSSGSGKSTLLYNLSGMDKVTAGTITYEENCISEYDEKQLALLRRSEFGFVFQQMHLVSNLTLFENVAVPAYLNKKYPKKEIDEKTGKLLLDVNIDDAAKRLPSQVSGGEQQRAAIVRAVINEPKILFADEPTGALNKQNTMDVLELLSKLNAKGQSIVMVTHDVRSAIRGNRILYLEDGNVISELELSPYDCNDIKSRETQMNAWLASLSW